MSIKGKIKKLVTGTIILVGFLLGLAQVSAQENLKIGFVNIDVLLANSPQLRSADVVLQEEFAPRQREIVAMQQSLQGKGETLQRDGAVMGEEERTNLERDIRNEQRDLERAVNELNEDADIRRNEELTEVQRLLFQEIQIFGRNEGYDLLISPPGVTFASSAVDVTDTVLQQLEETSAASAAP